MSDEDKKDMMRRLDVRIEAMRITIRELEDIKRQIEKEEAERTALPDDARN